MEIDAQAMRIKMVKKTTMLLVVANEVLLLGK
jgi:hypothetical protein